MTQEYQYHCFKNTYEMCFTIYLYKHIENYFKKSKKWVSLHLPKTGTENIKNMFSGNYTTCSNFDYRAHRKIMKMNVTLKE